MDTKHHLIVAHEVTNVGNDHGRFGRMAVSAKSAIGRPKRKVLADRGHFSGPEMCASHLNEISVYVPKPLTSASTKNKLFTKSVFVYLAKDDVYRCPAGERAIHRFNTVENDMNLRVYWPRACPRCPMKERCSPSTIAGREGVLEAMQRRLDRKPDAMTIPRSTVEHVFGTLNHWMGPARFLTRTPGRVSAKMSLQVLVYNIKRCREHTRRNRGDESNKDGRKLKPGGALLRALLN